jgi:hypothetical protein
LLTDAEVPHRTYREHHLQSLHHHHQQQQQRQSINGH